MPRFLPKDAAEEVWLPLTPDRDYAIRSNSDETVLIRFGQKLGLYAAITGNSGGNNRIVQSIGFDNGDYTVLGNISSDIPVTVGRSSDCNVKIMHPIISRQHVKIRLDGNILVVRDLGSKNGTFCLRDNILLDIDHYLEAHPIEGSAERTLDAMHEAFGPDFDDFLKLYSEQKGQQHGTDDNDQHEISL